MTVADEEDPQPTVTCTPASGSLFPMGTTTVACTARDAAGNQTVATFTVEVEATARTDKEAVRDALESMLPTGDQETDAAISEATENLGRALDPRYWTDGDRLVPELGQDVFDHEKAAVDALRALPRPGDGIMAAIAALVDVDELLADTAIGDAEAAVVDHADGDDRQLEKAHRDLQRARDERAKARDELAAGRPAQAIIRCRQAWFRAQQAIAWAQAATSGSG